LKKSHGERKGSKKEEGDASPRYPMALLKKEGVARPPYFLFKGGV